MSVKTEEFGSLFIGASKEEPSDSSLRIFGSDGPFILVTKTRRGDGAASCRLLSRLLSLKAFSLKFLC